jgi:hypothetical protein
VLTFSRRFSAVVIVLALSAGSPAVCAGWMQTAEERMACCMDESSCPMHKADASQHHASRVITQADADRCCATSERDDPAPTPSTIKVDTSRARAIMPIPAVTPVTAPGASRWRASPPPPARVPRHLLFSILIV